MLQSDGIYFPNAQNPVSSQQLPEEMPDTINSMGK
jgi:hypothetical protein